MYILVFFANFSGIKFGDFSWNRGPKNVTSGRRWVSIGAETGRASKDYRRFALADVPRDRFSGISRDPWESPTSGRPPLSSPRTSLGWSRCLPRRRSARCSRPPGIIAARCGRSRYRARVSEESARNRRPAGSSREPRSRPGKGRWPFRSACGRTGSCPRP